ncbi:arginine decarboxylase [Carboxylicivirga sp. A043]|uniref:arginine decarboxylase n=1 Tax=Carboxylicivirga litoralis TaxID=2816963 RepID=UPI0021CAF482|nr:arginine decarboxylase [Carboxylicivirga sp. A043]MCU4155503.1 arginine decarboxylase [Carboxylicivirga sp. A043]
MKNTYFELIEQSYYFPQEGFDLRDSSLTFHGVSLKHLIDKYGTPFKLIYLPKIGDQIKKARNLFNRAIKNQGYTGKYEYCYCTKCNHFYHVINEALKHDVNLETSSAYDIDLIRHLADLNKLDKNRKIIHNGYKTQEYLSKIVALQADGFHNSILILDSITELERLKKLKLKTKIKVGIRMAINEEMQSAYYTSRLGIPHNELMDFFKKSIKNNPNIELKMLHFFVDSGIKDTLYYWGQFQNALSLYVDLRKECESLDSFNLGGGFPIRNHLGFEYNYEYMINEIIKNIKEACTKENIPEPDIYTEFGKYTVGEAGAIIFEVLEQKKQNDSETWYIINNSLMNTIPDAWSIHEKFILLPINKWNNQYQRINIGGISCDHSDYYNSEDLNQEILLPQYGEKDKEPLYLGFFHTGAYQDSISGYGGIKHCLIPSPKHVIIDRDDKGNYKHYVYREEQSAQEMFKILGYQAPAKV